MCISLLNAHAQTPLLQRQMAMDAVDSRSLELTVPYAVSAAVLGVGLSAGAASMPPATVVGVAL